MIELDKDQYVRAAEQLVENEGFGTVDQEHLKTFLQSTAGKKVIGTMSIQAKNHIMSMASIDFSTPTAPIQAQSLRSAAMALNSFIDTIFALIEEPEENPDG
jgi:predicted transcriptional regulator